MKVPEIRQALASAVDNMKAADAAINVAKAAVAKAADQEVAKTDVANAEKAYTDAKSQAESLQADLTRALEVERLSAESAVQRNVPDATLAAISIRTETDREAIKQAPMALMMGSMIERHSEGAIKALAFIEREYGSAVAGVVKTQTLSDYATGGALSLPDFASTIISGLENMTVVRRMNPQTLTVPGALMIPSETSAPTGSWAGENQAPTPQDFTFGDIRLDPKRLPVETVVSRRLLTQAAQGGVAVRNLEGFIVRRLRERLAVNEDAGFLRGSGTQFVPLGLRSQIAASNVKVQTSAIGAVVATDLRNLITQLQIANIMITDGYWIMAPRTRAFLADMRDTLGFKIYPSIDDNNTLLSYPILMTNQIPVNLGAGAETEIWFGNGPSIIVANSSDAEIRVSIEGSYQQGTEHRSLIQRNEMLIHMEMYSDCKLERPTALSVLTGVTY